MYVGTSVMPMLPFWDSVQCTNTSVTVSGGASAHCCSLHPLLTALLSLVAALWRMETSSVHIAM